MRLQRLCTRFNVASGLLFALCWAYVLLVPFTKVEESFSLHAVHDLLLYGPAGDTAKVFFLAVLSLARLTKTCAV